MSLLRKRAAVGLTLALAATGLTAPLASANPAGTGLVISEVYGGGGNSGATFTNDFIELYNPTGSAISVDGWSVQYRGATGTGAGAVTPLTGTVPAGGHYLVQEAAGTGGTTALPTPDATGTIAWGVRRPGLALHRHDRPDSPCRQRRGSRWLHGRLHRRLRRRKQLRHLVRDGEAGNVALQHHLCHP